MERRPSGDRQGDEQPLKTGHAGVSELGSTSTSQEPAASQTLQTSQPRGRGRGRARRRARDRGRGSHIGLTPGHNPVNPQPSVPVIVNTLKRMRGSIQGTPPPLQASETIAARLGRPLQGPRFRRADSIVSPQPQRLSTTSGSQGVQQQLQQTPGQEGLESVQPSPNLQLEVPHSLPPQDSHTEAATAGPPTSVNRIRRPLRPDTIVSPQPQRLPNTPGSPTGVQPQLKQTPGREGFESVQPSPNLQPGVPHTLPPQGSYTEAAGTGLPTSVTRIRRPLRPDNIVSPQPQRLSNTPGSPTAVQPQLKQPLGEGVSFPAESSSVGGTLNTPRHHQSLYHTSTTPVRVQHQLHPPSGEGSSNPTGAQSLHHTSTPEEEMQPQLQPPTGKDFSFPAETQSLYHTSPPHVGVQPQFQPSPGEGFSFPVETQTRPLHVRVQPQLQPPSGEGSSTLTGAQSLYHTSTPEEEMQTQLQPPTGEDYSFPTETQSLYHTSSPQVGVQPQFQPSPGEGFSFPAETQSLYHTRPPHVRLQPQFQPPFGEGSSFPAESQFLYQTSTPPLGVQPQLQRPSGEGFPFPPETQYLYHTSAPQGGMQPQLQPIPRDGLSSPQDTEILYHISTPEVRSFSFPEETEFLNRTILPEPGLSQGEDDPDAFAEGENMLRKDFEQWTQWYSEETEQLWNRLKSEEAALEIKYTEILHEKQQIFEKKMTELKEDLKKLNGAPSIIETMRRRLQLRQQASHQASRRQASSSSQSVEVGRSSGLRASVLPPFHQPNVQHNPSGSRQRGVSESDPTIANTNAPEGSQGQKSSSSREL